MEYFLLNINSKGVNYVDYWIKERNIAPVFYDNSTMDKILKNSRNFSRDTFLFLFTFLKFNIDIILFSIGNSKIYIYKQKDIIKDYNINNEIVGGDIVKGFEIEILKEIEIKYCPLILITIKSNRYMSSGTLRKLKPILENNTYYGNILSIHYLLSNKKQEVNSFMGYLYCLSSLEFETLIAKMYEEKGYFVPAYKGGYIKNFDLFCTKDNITISLQIKLEMEKKYYNLFTDYFYCINDNSLSGKNIKNWISIKKELKNCPDTKEWLRKTLYWVKFEGEI